MVGLYAATDSGEEALAGVAYTDSTGVYQFEGLVAETDYVVTAIPQLGASISTSGNDNNSQMGQITDVFLNDGDSVTVDVAMKAGETEYGYSAVNGQLQWGHHDHGISSDAGDDDTSNDDSGDEFGDNDGSKMGGGFGAGSSDQPSFGIDIEGFSMFYQSNDSFSASSGWTGGYEFTNTDETSNTAVTASGNSSGGSSVSTLGAFSTGGLHLEKKSEDNFDVASFGLSGGLVFTGAGASGEDQWVATTQDVGQFSQITSNSDFSFGSSGSSIYSSASMLLSEGGISTGEISNSNFGRNEITSGGNQSLDYRASRTSKIDPVIASDNDSGGGGNDEGDEDVHGSGGGSGQNSTGGGGGGDSGFNSGDTGSGSDQSDGEDSGSGGATGEDSTGDQSSGNDASDSENLPQYTLTPVDNQAAIDYLLAYIPENRAAEYYSEKSNASSGEGNGSSGNSQGNDSGGDSGLGDGTGEDSNGGDSGGSGDDDGDPSNDTGLPDPDSLEIGGIDLPIGDDEQGDFTVFSSSSGSSSLTTVSGGSSIRLGLLGNAVDMRVNSGSNSSTQGSAGGSSTLDQFGRQGNELSDSSNYYQIHNSDSGSDDYSGGSNSYLNTSTYVIVDDVPKPLFAAGNSESSQSNSENSNSSGNYTDGSAENSKDDTNDRKEGTTGSKNFNSYLNLDNSNFTTSDSAKSGGVLTANEGGKIILVKWYSDENFSESAESSGSSTSINSSDSEQVGEIKTTEGETSGENTGLGGDGGYRSFLFYSEITGEPDQDANTGDHGGPPLGGAGGDSGTPATEVGGHSGNRLTFYYATDGKLFSDGSVTSNGASNFVSSIIDKSAFGSDETLPPGLDEEEHRPDETYRFEEDSVEVSRAGSGSITSDSSYGITTENPNHRYAYESKTESRFAGDVEIEKIKYSEKSTGGSSYSGISGSVNSDVSFRPDGIYLTANGQTTETNTESVRRTNPDNVSREYTKIDGGGESTTLISTIEKDKLTSSYSNSTVINRAYDDYGVAISFSDESPIRGTGKLTTTVAQSGSEGYFKDLSYLETINKPDGYNGYNKGGITTQYNTNDNHWNLVDVVTLEYQDGPDYDDTGNPLGPDAGTLNFSHQISGTRNTKGVISTAGEYEYKKFSTMENPYTASNEKRELKQMGIYNSGGMTGNDSSRQGTVEYVFSPDGKPLSASGGFSVKSKDIQDSNAYSKESTTNSKKIQYYNGDSEVFGTTEARTTNIKDKFEKETNENSVAVIEVDQNGDTRPNLVTTLTRGASGEGEKVVQIAKTTTEKRREDEEPTSVTEHGTVGEEYGGNSGNPVKDFGSLGYVAEPYHIAFFGGDPLTEEDDDDPFDNGGGGQDPGGEDPGGNNYEPSVYDDPEYGHFLEEQMRARARGFHDLNLGSGHLKHHYLGQGDDYLAWSGKAADGWDDIIRLTGDYSYRGGVIILSGVGIGAIPSLFAKGSFLVGTLLAAHETDLAISGIRTGISGSNVQSYGGYLSQGIGDYIAGEDSYLGSGLGVAYEVGPNLFISWRNFIKNRANKVAPRSIDLMDEVGQLGGELFPAEKIPALVKYLDRRGIYLHEGINGSFDGVRGIMTLPRNPTRLNVRHELSHMLDYKKYGDAYYTKFTPAQREQMVLDRLKNNRIWDQLNDLEREWSLNYPSTRR